MHQTTSCGATGGQACYWSWGWATGTGWWMVWQARWCQQLRGHNAGQNEWFGGCLLSLAIQPFQVVSKLRTQRHWVICWASKIVEEMTRGQCVWSLDSNNNDLQSALGIWNHCLKGSLLSQPSRKNIWFCGALHSFQKNCCLGDWVPDPRKLPRGWAHAHQTPFSVVLFISDFRWLFQKRTMHLLRFEGFSRGGAVRNCQGYIISYFIDFVVFLAEQLTGPQCHGLEAWTLGRAWDGEPGNPLTCWCVDWFSTQAVTTDLVSLLVLVLLFEGQSALQATSRMGQEPQVVIWDTQHTERTWVEIRIFRICQGPTPSGAHAIRGQVPSVPSVHHRMKPWTPLCSALRTRNQLVLDLTREEVQELELAPVEFRIAKLFWWETCCKQNSFCKTERFRQF